MAEPGTAVHVVPESVEVKIPVSAAATNLVRSAEDASENQLLLGAVVVIQETPESLET